MAVAAADRAAFAQHIFTFAESFVGGGVERALLRLIADWVAEGRRVTLALGTSAGPLAAELPDGVDVIERGSASYLGLMLATTGLVRRVRPDVIFCPGNYYSLYAAWLRLRLGRECPPIAIKVSNTLDRPDMRLLRLPYRWWLARHPRFADRMVAMSPYLAHEIATLMRMPADRVRVVADPAPLIPPDTGAPDGLPSAPFLIGVGRLTAQKRWDRAVKALAQLGDDARLLILGEGEDRRQLEALRDRLGLGGRLVMPGYVADPMAAMRRAAAMVLTSDFEGVPAVLREAVAVGTPVIATESSPAVRAVIGEPSRGTVLARDDMAGLVAAMRHWLSPDTPRPAPLDAECTSGRDYLAVFDELASASRSS